MLYTKSTCSKITFPQWYYLPIIQAHLPWQLPFLQHVLWWWYNYLDILSFITEILLFYSVFYGGVTPVSVSTLKPLLGIMLWDTLNTNNFYFIFLILYWFYIDFIFLLDNEKTHDTAVTWQVTWCDIIGLEYDRRI